MEKVGLFFGSFNPVHVGHMVIANYMAEHADLDRIWMVVTPHNPHKNKKNLANDFDRLQMVQLALEDNEKLEACDVEFYLPKPSYTVDTLAYLTERYTTIEFSLIMGGDNLASLHKWKNYEVLLERHKIYVYSRPSYDLGDLKDHPSVEILDAPMLEISASYIRKQITEGKSVKYLLTEPVYDFLQKNDIYR